MKINNVKILKQCLQNKNRWYNVNNKKVNNDKIHFLLYRF